MKNKNLEVGAPSESEQSYQTEPGILLVFILIVVERKAPKQRMSILSRGCLAELGYSVTVPVQGNLIYINRPKQEPSTELHTSFQS